jgi:hypothetical protein
MRLIFCSDLLNPRQPDSADTHEVAAAERRGIDYSLINFEVLANDAEAAVRRVAPAPEDSEIGVYCGWVMTTEQYAVLFDALANLSRCSCISRFWYDTYAMNNSDT